MKAPVLLNDRRDAVWSEGARVASERPRAGRRVERAEADAAPRLGR